MLPVGFHNGSSSFNASFNLTNHRLVMNAGVRCLLWTLSFPRLWLVRKNVWATMRDSPRSHSGSHQNGRTQVVLGSELLHYTIFTSNQSKFCLGFRQLVIRIYYVLSISQNHRLSMTQSHIKLISALQLRNCKSKRWAPVIVIYIIYFLFNFYCL